jgi:hypothetical protein
MFGENPIRLFQRFLASDIEPLAGDLKRVYRLARIEPLQK